MRFLLISPYDECCVGLRSIGAVLQADGHAVRFIHIAGFVSEFVPYEDEALAADILARNPLIARDVEPLGDIFINSQQLLDERGMSYLLDDYLPELQIEAIGISVWVGLEGLGAQITRAVRERYPQIPVIWGGTYPTLFPKAALEHAPIVCVGEGEVPMREWAAAPGRRDIPGLWFRDGGAIVSNGAAPVPDLDTLPFPLYRHKELTLNNGLINEYTSDDLALIGRNVILASARYCRFDCAYCLSGRMRHAGQTRPRRKSVDRFLAEIEHVAQLCQLPEVLAFWDDDFAEDPEWVAEFAEKYPSRIGRPFNCNTNPAVAEREAIKLLVKAGARGFALGLQSGSPRVLREVYRRSPDLDKLIDLAHFIRGLGIKHLQIDTITNSPFETEADCRATLETILRLPKPCDVHLAKLVLYPGSRLADDDGPHGGLTGRDFDFWNMLYLLAGTGALSPDELRALADDLHLRQHPSILRKMAHAMRDEQERIRQMEMMNWRQTDQIVAYNHMLQYSCHKSLGAILRDKIRYRILRWRQNSLANRTGEKCE